MIWKVGRMKQENRAVTRTKEKLKISFLKVLSEKKDVERIFVQDITDLAEVSKSTFYYHFDDIYHLIEELDEDIFGNMNDLLDSIYRLKGRVLQNYVETCVRRIDQYEEYIRALINTETMTLFIKRLKHSLIKRLTEDYLMELPPLRRSFRAHFFINAVVDTITDYYRGVFDADLMGIINEIRDIIYKFQRMDRKQQQDERSNE